MKKLYQAIVQIEFMFLKFYKIDPYQMIESLTMTDLQALIQRLEITAKEEKENKQGDKLMKSLIAIRDILNYMTLPVN